MSSPFCRKSHEEVPRNMFVSLFDVTLAKNCWLIWFEIGVDTLISYQSCIQDLMTMNGSMLVRACNFTDDFPQPRSKGFSWNFVNTPHKANFIMSFTPVTLGSKLVKVTFKLFSRAPLIEISQETHNASFNYPPTMLEKGNMKTIRPWSFLFA